jgi:hypothetical protein
MMPTIGALPAKEQAICGVVRFMPVETFQKDADPLLLLERIIAPEPAPPSTADWPRIHAAIRRGDLFVLETAAPSFGAMLRFSPKNAEAGDYEIHWRSLGGVERGRTNKVTALSTEAADKDDRLLGLRELPVRYAVWTVANARPFTCMIWLIGLSSYKNVDEIED